MPAMSGYVFTKRFLLALAAVIIWMLLPCGIFLLVHGIDLWGSILLTCALAVFIVALDGRIFRAVENRYIPRSNAMFMIIGWVNSALIVIVFLYSSISICRGNAIYVGVYALVTVALLAFCAWSLFTSKYIPS